jgi:hypothetical protein
MPSLGRMCYLTTVVGSFHGRVLAARLGAEGIVVVLRGVTDGPYPIQSAVDILVPAEQLSLAREILLADAVDDAFSSMEPGEADEADDDPADLGACRLDAEADRSERENDEFAGLPLLVGSPTPPPRSPRIQGAAAALVVGVVALLVVVAFLAATGR